MSFASCDLRLSIAGRAGVLGRCVALLLLGLAAAGCNVAGVMAATFSPPPKVSAEYSPPKTATLVLVENYQNPDAVLVQSERLDRDIAHEFSAHKVAPVVDPERLLDLKASKGSEFARMDIRQVGRALGARQVVYVELQKFSVSPPAGSEMIRGEAEALVKVVDSQSGRVLWPLDNSLGRQVKCETKYQSPGDGATPDSVQEQVYQNLTTRVARLFYDWESEKVDGTEPSTGGLEDR